MDNFLILYLTNRQSNPFNPYIPEKEHGGGILTKVKRTVILLTAIISSWYFAIAQAPLLLIQPQQPIQGDPLMVSLPDTSELSDVKSLMFDSMTIPLFLYKEHPTAFVGINLNAKTGTHTFTITLSNGRTIKQTLTILERDKEIIPLGIPEKMGGNTPTSQTKLVTSLEKENLLLDRLVSNKKKLWTGDFVFPIANPVVVDPYGYTRETGSYAIAHKGTDFRAAAGTEIRSMNRGVVRMARYSPIYGNVVVVDHGMGLMTFYMHLSKIKVKTGQLTERGQLIGLSGQTGYAIGPHLHLSVRLNGTSIDPMKFMELFK